MKSLAAIALGVSTLLLSTGFNVRHLSDHGLELRLPHRLHELRMSPTEQRQASIPVPTTDSPIQSQQVKKATGDSSDKLSTKPAQAPVKTMAERIKAFGDAGEWGQAKKLFITSKRPNAEEYSAAIYAARVCKEHTDGMKLYRMMVKSLGQEYVNLYIYDNVISLNLDYGDDVAALKTFNDLLLAEKKKKEKYKLLNKEQPKRTPSKEINLQKCVFNALRASLNIQFQDSKALRIGDERVRLAVEREVHETVKVKPDEIAFFDASSPSKNAMEETISSILQQDMGFLPRDKSLIVRAYASWNMTVQLAEMTDFIFQDPLPDMWTLETYMKAMLETYPELALLSLQWYLPIINAPSDSAVKEGNSTSSILNTGDQARGTETLLSGIISNTVMTEKRRGRDIHSTRVPEIVSARCLGLAVKALARLDYFVGECVRTVEHVLCGWILIFVCRCEQSVKNLRIFIIFILY
jgi:hypothetical protein